MSRVQVVLILLSMPLWLGVLLVLWAKSPYLILVPCGIISIAGLLFTGLMAYAAELKTVDDWDLVIRSILHRLGFNVAPPKSLGADIDLNHDHHQEQDVTP